MKFTRFIIPVLSSFISGLAFSQNAGKIKSYIDAYKDLAISEMYRTGVPASIKLAQGIYETSAGTSMLVMKSNNHFGIKCKSNWKGESVSHDDDAKGECFRKYNSAEDSYKDHSDFLKNSKRYASLFLLDPEDYAGWAQGLKNAGYATNPKYPQALIKLVEEYKLNDYTLTVLKKNKSSNDENTGISNLKDDPSVEEIASSGPLYPEGVFLINETRVVYIIKGTSFLSIAQQHNLPLSRIFEFNEIRVRDESDKDQLIFLQRKRKTGSNEFHIVLPGETLHNIAQSEAIRLESLKELNWLKDTDRPAPGERLYLQKKSPVIPRLMVKENFLVFPDTKTKSAN